MVSTKEKERQRKISMILNRFKTAIYNVFSVKKNYIKRISDLTEKRRYQIV